MNQPSRPEAQLPSNLQGGTNEEARDVAIAAGMLFGQEHLSALQAVRELGQTLNIPSKTERFVWCQIVGPELLYHLQAEKFLQELSNHTGYLREEILGALLWRIGFTGIRAGFPLLAKIEPTKAHVIMKQIWQVLHQGLLLDKLVELSCFSRTDVQGCIRYYAERNPFVATLQEDFASGRKATAAAGGRLA